MRYVISGLLSICFLTSCSVLPPYKPVSVKELLPVGSQLRLTQPLEIPAGKSYVFIANGEVKPFKNYNSVDHIKPYCEFQLQEAKAVPQSVAPGVFKIVKIVEWKDFKVDTRRLQFADARYAEISIGTGHGIVIGVGGFDGDGGSSMIMYATILNLSSPEQPQVKRLVCGHWDEDHVVEPITLEQFKSALGELIRVEEAQR